MDETRFTQRKSKQKKDPNWMLKWLRFNSVFRAPKRSRCRSTSQFVVQISNLRSSLRTRKSSAKTNSHRLIARMNHRVCNKPPFSKNFVCWLIQICLFIFSQKRAARKIKRRKNDAQSLCLIVHFLLIAFCFSSMQWKNK